MAINLLNIQPHKISRDLSGYITYIYGAPKTGKTTLGSQMPGALILAFERGYNALAGVIAQDITSWTELRQVYRELKKPEVQEVYKSIIVDTVDIAAALCEKYICNQLEIDALGDLGYGKGWTAFKKEFEEIFRGLTQLGYAVCFISHDKESQEVINGEERTIVRPSLSNAPRNIIENMADIYGYAKSFMIDGKSQVKLLLRSLDNTISCGCRFKYIEPVIDFNYKSLAEALNEAIDKESQATDGKYVTDEKNMANISKTYDYDALMEEFNTLVTELMGKDEMYYAPRIKQIIEQYLGKGKKITNATLDQAEFIFLINEAIKTDLK